MNKGDKIVILGITGYTGSWLTQKLFDAGFTNIVGTYRSQEKMDYLQSKFPKVVGKKVDLLDEPQVVADLLKGAIWVFNNSAPFTGKEVTNDDFIHTKLILVDNLFKAINESGTVKKLVHLGSAASVAFGVKNPNKQVINEDDWTDLNSLDYPYERFVVMKTYEENRIWELEKLFNFDVTIFHPTNVVGPSNTPWQHDMIYANLHNANYKADGPMDCIDVRDLAAAEIALMNNSASDGKRVLGIGFSISNQQLVDITRDTLTESEIESVFGNPLPKIIPAEVALSLWDPISYTSFYKDIAWRLITHSVLKTKYPELYTYQYIDGKQSVTDSLKKMLADTVGDIDKKNP